MHFKDYLISLNLSNQTINTHMKNMGIGMPIDDFKEDKLMSFIKDENILYPNKSTYFYCIQV